MGSNIRPDNRDTATRSYNRKQSSNRLQIPLQFYGRHPKPITIPREPNPLSSAFRPLARLDPLTPSSTPPDTLHETEHPLSHIGAIMLAHDRLDGISGFTSMIEGNAGDGVV